MKSEVLEQYKDLDHRIKAKLKKSGIRFGYKTIYDATLLKPEASKVRISLFNVFHNATETKVLKPPPGLVTIEYDNHISKQQYLVAGFFVAGSRAIRIDILERFYFLIKEHSNDEWIAIQSTMLSITGLGVEDFTSLIKSLRFEIKYEKATKRNEVIMIEKEDGLYKVLFKKQSRDTSVKKFQIRGTLKKGRKNRKNSKTKNQIAISDSPFSSLKVLLKN